LDALAATERPAGRCDIARFALIHFDGGLYQSTIDAFDLLFTNRMISTRLLSVRRLERQIAQSQPTGNYKPRRNLSKKHGTSASSGGDYSVGGTRFIIHSYRGIPADPA
jgi:O-methyltransferase